MGRRCSKKVRKHIQIIYITAAVLWILTTYALKVYKAYSPVGYLILLFPLIVYALGFLNSGRITRKIEKNILGSDFLVIGILFVSVLFEISHHHYHHFTVNIIVLAFALLVFSCMDVITGESGLIVCQHIRSVTRTAAVTLLIFVIWVNISHKLPMKHLDVKTTGEEKLYIASLSR